MKTHSKNQAGFTLVELVALLLLIGIVAGSVFLVRHCNWFSF